MRGGWVLAVAVAAQAAAACSEPCCTYDSQPIPLTRARRGELVVQVSVDGAGAAPAILDTGSPVSIVDAPASDVRLGEVRLLGLAAPMGTQSHVPTRAIFRQTALVP